MITRNATATIAARRSLIDRILTEAWSNVSDLDDLERCRQRAGSENEREIRRGLKIAASHGDLTAASDRALNDRRPSHHAVVEDDRHVVLDVSRRLAAEFPAADVVELELDDRAFGRRRVRLCVDRGSHP